MNILLINHYAGSVKHGMEYRPYYLAREWTKMEHRVTIIAASYSHLRREQPPVREGEVAEIIDGIRYLWLKTPAYEGNNVGRICNMLVFVARLFLIGRRISRKIKPDVVIASSTYPLDIYPAAVIAKLSRAKLFFEVHDLWPLTPMELSGLSKWHPFIMIMQAAENYAYRKADKVISLLPKALKYMMRHGLSPEKFLHIPNGIDIEEWQRSDKTLPPEHSGVIKKLKQDGRFIVGYAGAHGTANALDYFMEAAILIQDLPVSLLLVGQGPEKERLQKYVLQKGLKNVIFLPSIPKTNVPSLLKSMDILYIGLQKSPSFRFGLGSPNKLFDYMAAGKPIIQAIETENDLVMESNCGISVLAEDSPAIAEAIKKLINMSAEEREEMGQKGREYVMAYHDYRVLARRFWD